MEKPEFFVKTLESQALALQKKIIESRENQRSLYNSSKEIYDPLQYYDDRQTYFCELLKIRKMLISEEELFMKKKNNRRYDIEISVETGCRIHVTDFVERTEG